VQSLDIEWDLLVLNEGTRPVFNLLYQANQVKAVLEAKFWALYVHLIGQADFFAVFTFAHRARCAAAILLRALADIVSFLGIVTTFAFPLLALTFTHRALWAAAILALPAADILPRRAVPYAAPKAESAAPPFHLKQNLNKLIRISPL